MISAFVFNNSNSDENYAPEHLELHSVWPSTTGDSPHPPKNQTFIKETG